ncbi:MAG: MFS transporter [Dehalococcoidia bacterium]|nr:MFS transporter [Dehalococcoidia bacterium]
MKAQETRQSGNTESRFRYGYVVVAACFVIALVAEGVEYSFGVFFEPLLSEFGWTRAITSGALSLASVVHIPILLLAGRLTDRFGPRILLSIGGFFFGLGYLLMSQTNTIWQLYLCYGVIASIGFGLYWIPVASTIPQWFTRRRGLMMGIVTAGIGIGTSIMPPLTSQLIYTYGWRSTYLIIGSMSMGAIVISAQFLRRSPNQFRELTPDEPRLKQENIPEQPKEFSFREVIHTRSFWMFATIFFSWALCLSIIMVHVVIHAIGLGVTPASAANIMAIIGITGIVGRIAFGRLSDVIGMKPALIISFALLSIAFMWLLVAREAWMLYLFAAVFGIAYGTIEVLQSPLLAKLFGLKSLGSVLGASTAFAAMGFSIGSVLAGYIFDTTGSYTIAFMICIAMGLIGTILNVFLPTGGDKRKQDKSQLSSTPQL